MQLELTVYLSIFIASVGVIGAVIYYVFEQRNQTRMRKTDMIFRIYQQFFNKEFVETNRKAMSLEFKDYDDFEQKYGPYPSEAPASIAVELVIYFFEGLGTLLKNGLIEIHLVHDLFNVPGWWEKFWPLTSAIRDQLDRSDIYSNFEYLYDAYQNYEKENLGK